MGDYKQYSIQTLYSHSPKYSIWINHFCLGDYKKQLGKYSVWINDFIIARFSAAPFIIKATKSRNMRWSVLVARMEQIRYWYKIWF
jgi:hypothetical protein